jgi:GNAT superfamily N-acetyltransferase
VSLRAARAADCAALTAIMQASRAYDGAYRAHALGLRVTPEDLATRLVRVQEEEGAPRGFYSLLCRTGECELDLMFVADAFQRRGIGRTLFADMAAAAHGRGYASLLIVSHPPAAGFYERMGARRAGVEPPRGNAAWPRPRFRIALGSDTRP